MWIYTNSDDYKGTKPIYDDIEKPYETASFQRSSGRKIPQETVIEAYGFQEWFLSGGDGEDYAIEDIANLTLQDAVTAAVSQYIGLYPTSTERQKEDFKAAIGIVV